MNFFFNNAMEGQLGPTAQFWSVYISMINRVHKDLMRAVRTNDVGVYIKTLPAIIDIFFCIKPTELCSMGVLFLNHMKKASPQSLKILENGAFSMRRTGKNFSRSAIDLTLEQTGSRDAASPMRGIVGFHYTQSAIQRWCLASTQRGMSVTQLREITGLQKEDHPATQLQALRISKDSRQRDELFYLGFKIL